jgi:hypothetical protein
VGGLRSKAARRDRPRAGARTRAAPGRGARRRPATRVGLALLALLAWAGAAGADAADPAQPIPNGTIPYRHPAYWPHHLRSARHPIDLHYRRGEEAIARETLAALEDAWDLELRLGFRPPPLAPGTTALDVYIWRGSEECYAAWRSDEPATPWADASTYMVIDPDGPHGRGRLPQLLAHELNHVFQGADDWYEFRSAFEGTATFVEWLAGGLDAELAEVVADFQARPHWSLDRDDGGKTWYTYGFALYLRFLQARHAGGDPRFLGHAWLLARNPPGAEDDPRRNRPALSDALERALPGLRYVESAAEFARWRFYTGRHADAAHDPDAASIPAVATRAIALRRGERARVPLDPAPMLLGSSYIEVAAGDAGAISVSLEAPRDPDVRYVVQAVPGLDPGSDGEVLAFAPGRARVGLAAGGTRTLIVTPLPAAGAPYDPNRHPRKTCAATLVLERP